MPFEESEFVGQSLAFAFQFGFQLADACGLSAFRRSIGIYLPAKSVAPRAQLSDDSFALCSQRFEAGAGRGLGLRLRQLPLRGSKPFGVVTELLFQQGLFEFGGVCADEEAQQDSHQQSSDGNDSLHHLIEFPLRLMYAFGRCNCG